MRNSPITEFWRGAQREDWLAVGAILLAALIAWSWILTRPPMDPNLPQMGAMEAMVMPAPQWSLGRVLATFSMWAIMMTAMMLPSAAPIVVLHRRVAGANRVTGSSAPPTGALTLGYTCVWIGFGALATIGQWALAQASLLDGSDALIDHRIAAGVLVAAGLYQFAPVKQSCLRFCRSPVSFLMRYYFPGALGAFRMGLIHGTICVVCCWALMALLFVGGVMNVLWISGLTALALLEKALPFGEIASKALGAAAIAFGAYLLTTR